MRQCNRERGICREDELGIAFTPVPSGLTLIQSEQVPEQVPGLLLSWGTSRTCGMSCTHLITAMLTGAETVAWYTIVVRWAFVRCIVEDELIVWRRSRPGNGTTFGRFSVRAQRDRALLFTSIQSSPPIPRGCQITITVNVKDWSWGYAC